MLLVLPTHTTDEAKSEQEIPAVFGLFEHASMCNQKGGVKIQNRGPEQEIPAVTCVRLIAQKHRY